MKIKAKNTKILTSSFKFSENGEVIIYQANTELYIDGCLFEDLFTEKTIFNLTCPVIEIKNIQSITEEQVDNWINENYISE